MAKLRLKSTKADPSIDVATKIAKQAPKETIIERIVEVEKIVEKYIEKPVEKIYTQVFRIPGAMVWIIGIQSLAIAVLIHMLARK